MLKNLFLGKNIISSGLCEVFELTMRNIVTKLVIRSATASAGIISIGHMEKDSVSATLLQTGKVFKKFTFIIIWRSSLHVKTRDPDVEKYSALVFTNLCAWHSFTQFFSLRAVFYKVSFILFYFYFSNRLKFCVPKFIKIIKFYKMLKL